MYQASEWTLTKVAETLHVVRMIVKLKVSAHSAFTLVELVESSN